MKRILAPLVALVICSIFLIPAPAIAETTVFASNEKTQRTMVGDLIRMGNYDWTITGIQGSAALLVSTQVIGFHCLLDSQFETCWEESSLREYLNNEFFSSVFSDEEQSVILNVRNTNNACPLTNTSSGPETIDRVFLLSLDEVLLFFGNSSLENSKKYDTSFYGLAVSDDYNANRKTTHIGGVCKLHTGEDIVVNSGENYWWWLRTMGKDSRRVISILESGAIFLDGYQGGQEYGGVRPAMWIDLSKTPEEWIHGTIYTTEKIGNGSKGENVKIVQQKLIELGYLQGNADGIFGKMSEAALIQFQIDNNLEANGIASNDTIRYMLAISDICNNTDDYVVVIVDDFTIGTEAAVKPTDAPTAESMDEMTPLQVIYGRDKQINYYLNQFNIANPEEKITEDLVKPYYHHGRDHDDQIKFTREGFEVVISAGAYGNPLKVVIQDAEYRKKTYDDSKKIFCQYARGYTPSLSEDTLNDYWERLLNDITYSVVFDEFECSLTITLDKEHVESIVFYGGVNK